MNRTEKKQVICIVHHKSHDNHNYSLSQYTTQVLFIDDNLQYSYLLWLCCVHLTTGQNIKCSPVKLKQRHCDISFIILVDSNSNCNPY